MPSACFEDVSRRPSACFEDVSRTPSAFCEDVGIRPNFNAGVNAGGATGAIMVMQAAAMVEAGVCKHVLCVAGDNRVTGMTRDRVVAALAEFGHPQFEVPYGISIPTAYALVAQRYMHETGATLEHLAALSVTHRKHAAMHPDAHMTKPITMDDCADAKVISAPLRLLDCCLIFKFFFFACSYWPPFFAWSVFIWGRLRWVISFVRHAFFLHL